MMSKEKTVNVVSHDSTILRLRLILSTTCIVSHDSTILRLQLILSTTCN